MRFEWQYRGSPHVHGFAWLLIAPDVEMIKTSAESKLRFIQFIDNTISAINPAIDMDGSNQTNAPMPQTNPHICNVSYNDVEDYEQDLTHLIATCQHHTRCSAAYCLRTSYGQQSCRFGYPKPLQGETVITEENNDIEVLTNKNDSLINNFNLVQLQSRRANVDLQYCISCQKVVQYCAKYATKCESHSQTVKEVYRRIVGALNDEDKSLKAVQKLLISTVGERDFSAQETCHLLLQLPLCCATKDFIILSLDDCRIVEDHLDNERPTTAPSPLDHYIARPNSPLFQSMLLLHLTQNYSMPTAHRSEVVRRSKSVVVIVKPHLSSDTDGPQYEHYCKQQLKLCKPFRQISSLIAGFDTFIEAYTAYARSNEIPLSLENDIQQINTRTSATHTDNQDDNDEDDAQNDIHHQNIEEWMLLCRAYPMLNHRLMYKKNMIGMLLHKDRTYHHSFLVIGIQSYKTATVKLLMLTN